MVRKRENEEKETGNDEGRRKDAEPTRAAILNRWLQPRGIGHAFTSTGGQFNHDVIEGGREPFVWPSIRQ